MTTKTLAPGGGVQYWLSAASWSPSGVPGAGDDVVLSAGNALALTGTAAVGSVTVNGGAVLDVVPGAVLSATAINGGLLVAGSSGASASMQFLVHGNSLNLGPQSFLDVVGPTEFDGTPDAGSPSVGTYVNQGTILVGKGATLTLNDSLSNTGVVHIASGTLDASAAGSYSGSGSIAFDDAAGTLLVGNSGSYTVTGFRYKDSIALKGISPGAVSSSNYNVTPTSTTFTYGNLSILFAGQKSNTSYYLQDDGNGGSILGTSSPGAAAPTYALAASGTDGQTFTVTRSGDLSTAAVLSYAVAGTGTSPAVAADFAGSVLPTGMVTFVGGAASATITLLAGTAPATSQTYNVTVSGPDVSGLVAGGTVAAAIPVAAPPVSPPVATPPVTPPVVTPPVTPPVVTPPVVTPPVTPPVVTPPVTPPVVTPPVTPVSYGVVGFVNATTGEMGTHPLEAAGAGGPSYLQAQYIYGGSDSQALSTQQPNVFIHSGSGTDAIAVSSGQNVLDGGLGSNFMTGGSGIDTFFTDARAPGVVWNTLINFHSGDQATLFGFTAGISSYRWEANIAGAPGSQGATLRANIVGGAGRTGDGIDASITFAGLSVAQAQNLQIVTGTVQAGNYLFIYSP